MTEAAACGALRLVWVGRGSSGTVSHDAERFPGSLSPDTELAGGVLPELASPRRSEPAGPCSSVDCCARVTSYPRFPHALCRDPLPPEGGKSHHHPLSPPSPHWQSPAGAARPWADLWCRAPPPPAAAASHHTRPEEPHSLSPTPPVLSPPGQPPPVLSPPGGAACSPLSLQSDDFCPCTPAPCPRHHLSSHPLSRCRPSLSPESAPSRPTLASTGTRWC